MTSIRTPAAGSARHPDAVVRRAWQEVNREAEQIARVIWANPELGLMEKRSAEVLGQWLEGKGFEVTYGVAGLPTAFVAQYGEGDPAVGVLLEYDALPALGNEAEPKRAPPEYNTNVPGHACGHNMIGAANAAAAIAAKEAIDQGGAGRIVAYGTPAEEILFGKVVMLEEGVFDKSSVLFTHHADYANAAVSRPCQAIVHGEIAFQGRPAHTGVTRAQNALDAAELLVQTVERVRAHQFGDVSIEHAIRTPTFVMPSNTPEEVRVWFYVRHETYDRAAEVFSHLVDHARVAAGAVGVRAVDGVISSCRGYLPNDVLGELLWQKLQVVGAPAWDEEDLGFMRELSEAFAPDEDFQLSTDLQYRDEGIDAYGQDDGDVSWRIPLGRVNYACPTSIPLHSWAATALFGRPAAWKGAAMCGEALALAIAAVLSESEIIDRAQAELAERVPEPPAFPIPGEREAILEAPYELWAGRWRIPDAGAGARPVRR